MSSASDSVGEQPPLMQGRRGFDLAQPLTTLRTPQGGAITPFYSTGPSQGHQQWVSWGCVLWTQRAWLERGWGGGSSMGTGWAEVLVGGQGCVPMAAGLLGSMFSFLLLKRRLMRLLSRGLSSSGRSGGPSLTSTWLSSSVAALATPGSSWGPVSALVWSSSWAGSSSGSFSFSWPPSCSLESGSSS